MQANLLSGEFLDSAWKHDGVVTDRQYELMQWLSNALNISPDQMNSVIKEKASSRLVELLQRRFGSKGFNEKDRRHFENVLSISGQNLKEFVQPLLSDIHPKLENAIGRINWDNTSSAIARYKELCDETILFLSYSKYAFNIIASGRTKLVLDKKISAIDKKRCVSEEDVNELAELVEAFDLKNIPYFNAEYRSSYSEDIERKLQHLRSMTGLRRGKLPLIATPYEITLEADETVHAAFEARLLHYTGSRSQPDFYEGMFVVLNKRAIFQDGVGYTSRSSARRDLTFS